MKKAEGYELFLLVTQYGSFTEAARATHQSTTAVSRKIQLLEEELQIKLFNRTTRSLSLTEAGERLLPKAKLLIETFNDIKSEATLLYSEPTGTLRISAPPLLTSSIPDLFSGFLKKYPKIKLDLDFSGRNKNLFKDSFDFSFRIGTLDDSSMISLHLSSVKYILAGNSKLKKSLPPINHPREIVNYPCITNQIDGLIMPWTFSLNGKMVHHEVSSHVISNDLNISAALVNDGVGISYLPFGLVKQLIEEKKVVNVLNSWKPTKKELYLLYPNKKYLPLKSKVFIEFVRSYKNVIQKLLNPN